MDVNEAIWMDVESGQVSLRGTKLPLDERDLPGAALNGCDPATLTIPQLYTALVEVSQSPYERKEGRARCMVSRVK